MIFAEPSPTQADVHFRVLGFPVRVHPMFWVVTLLLSGGGEPASAAIWVAAVFVSILVHELGHALLQRFYGGRSHIVLHGMGGLAIAEGVRYTPWRQVLISLAGPFAGFALAAVLCAAVLAGGVSIDVRWPYLIPGPMDSRFTRELLFDLLQINILWGLLNLAPIYPLDGGRVARELLTMWLPAHRGVIASLWLSIICSGGFAFSYLSSGGGAGSVSWWPVLLFGMLAYNNYQMLRSYQASRGGGW